MAVATSRDDEIRQIWTENQWLYLVAGFLGGILFCLLLQLSIKNFSELILSLIPEATGIFVTITLIDFFNRRRDKRNAIRELQEQLVRDAGSIVNDVANNAVHQLRKRGWLDEGKGLLIEADLRNANLQGASLMGAKLQAGNLGAVNLFEANLMAANLQGAYLPLANLHRAILMVANLQQAVLVRANLQDANLVQANLQNANLQIVNLQGASLGGAKLQGADLHRANLMDVDFGQNEDTEFDEATRLPDGTFWTPETDMTKFTKAKAYDSE